MVNRRCHVEVRFRRQKSTGYWAVYLVRIDPTGRQNATVVLATHESEDAAAAHAARAAGGIDCPIAAE